MNHDLRRDATGQSWERREMGSDGGGWVGVRWGYQPWKQPSRSSLQHRGQRWSALAPPPGWGCSAAEESETLAAEWKAGSTRSWMGSWHMGCVETEILITRGTSKSELELKSHAKIHVGFLKDSFSGHFYLTPIWRPKIRLQKKQHFLLHLCWRYKALYLAGLVLT